MFEIHVNKFGDFTGNETVRREGKSDHGTKEDTSCCKCSKWNCFSCYADKDEVTEGIISCLALLCIMLFFYGIEH